MLQVEEGHRIQSEKLLESLKGMLSEFVKDDRYCVEPVPP